MKNNCVRPPCKTPRRALAHALGAFRKIVNGDRFSNLFAGVKLSLQQLPKCSYLLDYGCGAMHFSRKLREEGVVEDFCGVDIFTKPDKSEGTYWDKYHQVETGGAFHIPRRADVAMAIDVLHHIPEEKHCEVLSRLAEKSDYLLIKDHFESGWCSRQILRLADWYGNYAYGVNIPKRYFNRERWKILVKNAGLTEEILVQVKVHAGIFGLILPRNYHYISVLKRREGRETGVGEGTQEKETAGRRATIRCEENKTTRWSTEEGGRGGAWEAFPPDFPTRFPGGGFCREGKF